VFLWISGGIFRVSRVEWNCAHQNSCGGTLTFTLHGAFTCRAASFFSRVAHFWRSSPSSRSRHRSHATGERPRTLAPSNSTWHRARPRRKGRRTTDDWQAIQNAVNAANGTIQFPKARTESRANHLISPRQLVRSAATEMRVCDGRRRTGTQTVGHTQVRLSQNR